MYFNNLIVPILCVTLFLCNTITMSMANEAQIFFDSVPAEDREYFIIFHTNLAIIEQERKDVVILPRDLTIPEDKYNEFQSMTPPNNFANNLLEWVEKDFKDQPLREQHAPEKAKSRARVCFPSGCVDPLDLGTHCCPF